MRFLPIVCLLLAPVPDDLTAIRIDPSELVIDEPHRVLVSGTRHDGLEVDVRNAAWSASDAGLTRNMRRMPLDEADRKRTGQRRNALNPISGRMPHSATISAN